MLSDHPAPVTASESIVLTKATMRAAERLALSQKTLAMVLGLSESVVSRMKTGSYFLERGKPFELAALFVRLFRSLDAIVSGDEASARAWMTNPNLALNAIPAEAIRNVQGLVQVTQYLDARRAQL